MFRRSVASICTIAFLTLTSVSVRAEEIEVSPANAKALSDHLIVNVTMNGTGATFSVTVKCSEPAFVSTAFDVGGNQLRSASVGVSDQANFLCSFERKEFDKSAFYVTVSKKAMEGWKPAVDATTYVIRPKAFQQATKPALSRPPQR